MAKLGSTMSPVRVSAVDKLDPAIRADMEATAAAITAVFAEEKWAFKLNSPDKLTVSRGGVYSKSPFIGGESFFGARAYVGKSAKVIVVFDYPADKCEIEIPLNEALVKLQGISGFSTRLQAYKEDKARAEVRAEVQEKEAKALEEATVSRHIENPVFGSW